MPNYDRASLQEPTLPSLVELCEIQLTSVGFSEDARIFNDFNEEDGQGRLRWNGTDFYPFPFSISGFESSVEGATPRLEFSVSNLKPLPTFQKTLSQIAFENDDLLKVSVLRYQVWRDDLATPPNNATSPGFAVDDYRIIGVESDNKIQTDFTLASIIDLPSVQLPSDVMLRRTFPALDRFQR